VQSERIFITPSRTILFLALFLAGCKSATGSTGTQATGERFAVIHALADQLPPHVDEAGAPIVKAINTNAVEGSKENLETAKEFDRAIDALADEVDAHRRDNEKRNAEIKAVKATIGYRVEMAIRAFCRWLKWIVIGWATLKILAVVFGFIPALAPIGGVLSTVWRGINSFVIGLFPHGTNAANLIGRVSSIGVGDGSVARTPPI
jgi:hypothetical protein